ncbi:chorion class CA protein ERA.1-like [Cydia amplana]|uniref:chorion class CA protein ERA.1-like n=1 Tax=Cydia amplana TaxID=1869771 RepID=UPI002FE6C011
MSPLVVFALFVQACLIQSVLSQTCGFPQLPYGSGLNGLGGLNSANQISQSAPAPAPVPSPPCASYGGVGTGQVGVSGDIDASGQTVVVGSVPVLGSVDFSGTVPASGSVSISGQCGCGCNA